MSVTKKANGAEAKIAKSKAKGDMKNVAISLDRVTIKYGANEVISDARFEIMSGDFVCVVGANGAGKSTLVRGILGLTKICAGESKCDISRVGYMPQEAKIDLYFPATVMEIVLSGNLGRMNGKVFYGEEEKMRALKSLKLLGMADLAAKSFAELSGGQKQKVLLARALTAAKDILILDEPSNNLDHKSRTEFYQILKDLNHEQKMTIVMITHDLDADDLIGNKVVSIKQGRVEMSKTAEFLRSYK